MRAVNLIPADQRRASGGAGKSGGGVYALLGVLALIVACVAALTITSRQVADRTAEADRLDAQAQVAQAKAGNLAAYKTFNDLVKQRTAGVQTLAATRFNWGETLDQVSRVVPSDVSLTQLAASTAPGVGVGGTVSLRTALANPAIELIGCAPSHRRVALLMARLRRIEGVQRVSVANAAKSEGSSGGNASAGEDKRRSAAARRPTRCPSSRWSSSSGRRSPSLPPRPRPVPSRPPSRRSRAAPPAPPRPPPRRPRAPDMTNRDRIVVGVLACVVAIAGFWFLALKPKRAEAEKAATRAEQAETRLQEANSALATAAGAKKSFDSDYATIARLGKAVPEDDDAASLVFQIETAARKAGIDFRSLAVGGGAAAADAHAGPEQQATAAARARRPRPRPRPRPARRAARPAPPRPLPRPRCPPASWPAPTA